MIDKTTKIDSQVVRCLAPSESGYVPRGIYVGYIVQVRGNLDLNALTAALASTRRAHPVLSTHLESSDDTHVLIKSVDPFPGIKVCQGDILDPLAGIELDPGHALSAVHVVRDGDRAAVKLLIHHAIADARHGLAVLEDLWLSYSDFAEGRQPNLAFHEYPDAVEKILSDHGIGQFDYQSPSTAVITASSAKSSDINPPEFSSALLRCRLDNKHTAALIEFCHRTQLTVNAVVSAAIIQAEAGVRNVSLSEIRYFVTVDLRQRLSPSVADTAGTNVLGAVDFTADEGELELAELARAIRWRLPKGFEKSRTKYDTAAQIGSLVNNLLAPIAPGSVVTTNWGIVPALQSPKGLEIDDFRAVIYNKVEEPGILTPVRSESTQTYLIYSFRGELSIELLVTNAAYSDSAQTRIEFLKRILHALPANQSQPAAVQASTSCSS